MKIINSLLFLCVLVGACLSNGFSSTDVEINYDDDALVITSTKGIEDFCYTNDDCSDSLTICVDNRCQPIEDTIRWNNKYYSLNGTYCIESSNCMSTRTECRNNKCVRSAEFREGEWLCHNKSGASVCWGKKMSKGSPNILCRWVGYGLEIEGIVVNKLDGLTYCRFFYDSTIWELQSFEIRNQH